LQVILAEKSLRPGAAQRIGGVLEFHICKLMRLLEKCKHGSDRQSLFTRNPGQMVPSSRRGLPVRCQEDFAATPGRHR
jgi:phage gp37-like protein